MISCYDVTLFKDLNQNVVNPLKIFNGHFRSLLEVL
jgi:hypothetical protein